MNPARAAERPVGDPLHVDPPKVIERIEGLTCSHLGLGFPLRTDRPTPFVEDFRADVFHAEEFHRHSVEVETE